MNTLLLCIILLIPFVLAASDPCLTNSYAPGAVSAVTALSASTFSGVTTYSGVNNALNAILQISLTSTSAFVQDIFVGSTNSDFYMIKNCLTADTNPFCKSDGPQYLAYVRNTGLYSDNYRRVYAAVNGLVDVTATSTYVGIETSTYDPTVRIWFNTTTGWAGWTDVHVYASGGLGKTYSVSFASNTLVAAADKSFNEYCGACLSNSYAIPVVQTLAVTDFSSARRVTSTSALTGIATAMKNAVDFVGSANAFNILLGFDNGDTFMVKYCAQSADTAECKGHDLLFYVSSTSLNGDLTRKAYALSSSGAVGAVVATLESYNGTTRDWYQTKNGWTDVYTFVSSTNEGRSYSLPLNGGVVSATRLSTEPCTRDDATVGSGASSLVASLVFVTIAALVMM